MRERRQMEYGCLVGVHKMFVERKLFQCLSGQPIDIVEEIEFIKKNSLSTATCKELTSLATYLANTKCRLNKSTYVIKLSEYIFAVYDSKLSILPADKLVARLETMLEEAFTEHDKNTVDNIICYIHDYLQYFQIGSAMLVKMYRLEEKMAYLNVLKPLFKDNDTLFKYYYERTKRDYEKTLKTLVKNTAYTVRTWLLRELFYFHNSLENCEKYDFINAYKALFHGKDDDFYRIVETNNIDYFGCTNPKTYLNAAHTYYSARNLPALAKFNILLNLSHCNGTMATKYIRVRDCDLLPGMYSVIDFLDGLSDGKYSKDVPYKIYKELGVKPQWFVRH